MKSKTHQNLTINDYINKDPEVQSWWASIEDNEKRKLTLSWSKESESCKKSLSDNNWQDLPIIIVGSLTEKEDNQDWNLDLYEFFVNHPEFFISGLPICFHVCTSEKSIRDSLKRGIIESNFLCSGIENSHCFMNSILKIMKGKNLTFKAYKNF